MKKKILLFALCCLVIGAQAQTSQTKKKKKGAKYSKTSTKKKGALAKTKTVVPVASPALAVKKVDSTDMVWTGLGADSTVMDGAYTAKDFLNNKVTPYPALREADVMYRKRIWREIDVREKMNKFLTYPRQPLIDVLMEHIKAGELTAYYATSSGPKDNGDEFKRPYRRLSEFTSSTGGGKEKIQIADIKDPNSGVMKDSVVEKSFDAGSIVAYRLKEDWIFDKQRSVFEPRIIGIAPVVAQLNTNGDTIGTRALFWVYYPEARNVLAHAQVFNRHSDGTNLSFDDVFIKRMFSSYIIKESNSDDIPLKNYANVKNQMDALYEGERVKKDLMNYESDLWEY
jgi:gliding motility associated protien GldN